MHKANAYRALAQALERWQALPVSELIASVGKPASIKHENIDGEDIAIEVTLHWHGKDQAAIQIRGVAMGPSHWRFERLEESVVVALVSCVSHPGPTSEAESGCPSIPRELLAPNAKA